MCGIQGWISPPRRFQPDLKLLSHRGPDDAGVVRLPAGNSAWEIGLVHNRLAIIDLSPAGHQPMRNADGSLWVTFNGEIYNYPELARELRERGYHFQSRSDTEVLLHGYSEWGERLPERLRGMFAFALWDVARERLFLARDRLGKKPLFYALAPERFAFASEIKAILAAGFPAAPDPEALDHYLTYLYFPPPYTAFRGIRKLPPAHAMMLELRNGEMAPRSWRYWDSLPSAGDPLGDDYPGVVARLRELIEDAVRVRLMSDVPLGVLLSGGLDSSAIAAQAARHSTTRLRSFTVAFPEDSHYDEQQDAAQVSAALHLEHRVLVSRADSAAHLTTVVRHFDEPFGNPTAILEFELTRLTRQFITVALSGEGGDELFLGYPRYAGARLAGAYRHLPQWLTRGLVANLSARLTDASDGRHGFRRLREFAESGWQPLEDAYLRWVGYFSPAEKAALYTPAFRQAASGADPADFLRRRFQQGAALDPLSRLSYVDLESFLCCNVLEYSDRMSMANSLEIRCPLTDQHLVEFALRLPASWKMRRLRGKSILKEAIAPWLPAATLRKPKLGFNPPAGKWMRHDLAPALQALLGAPRIEQRGWFQPAAVASLIEAHRAGRRDYSLQLWALLALEVWQMMLLDGVSEEEIRERYFHLPAAATAALGTAQ